MNTKLQTTEDYGLLWITKLIFPENRVPELYTVPQVAMILRVVYRAVMEGDAMVINDLIDFLDNEL